MDGRYWPGGIPSTVRQHPEPIDDFNYEVITQGFRRFIRDNWVPRADESGPEQGFEYEDNQRRKLVESWACAEQAFREVTLRPRSMRRTQMLREDRVIKKFLTMSSLLTHTMYQ